ncbi:MAG: cytochrome c [Verrucomicrobiota bacterium]
MSDKNTAHPFSTTTIEHAKVGDDEMHAVHDQLGREKSEPSEGFTPVPIFLLFLFSGLIFWGGLYLEKASGHFRWDAYSPNFQLAGPGSGPTVDYESEEWLMSRGERIYSQQCAQCHQADGNGQVGAFPPLAGSPWVTQSEEMASAILIAGLAGPIEVLGNEYNGNMPAFGGVIRDRDIAAVLSYIRRSWGNSADLITPSEFEAYKAGPAGSSSGQWAAGDLESQFGAIN